MSLHAYPPPYVPLNGLDGALVAAAAAAIDSFGAEKASDPSIGDLASFPATFQNLRSGSQRIFHVASPGLGRENPPLVLRGFVALFF